MSWEIDGTRELQGTCICFDRHDTSYGFRYVGLQGEVQEERRNSALKGDYENRFSVPIERWQSVHNTRRGEGHTGHVPTGLWNRGRKWIIPHLTLHTRLCKLYFPLNFMDTASVILSVKYDRTAPER